MELRTGYNEYAGMDILLVDSPLECKDESLTVQADAVDADINVIVKKFVRTGVLPLRQVPPLEGDFSNVSDYHEAMNLIRQADESFMSVDADIRARFDNDPGKFVAFCSDEKNLDEMRKMGLAVPKDVPAEPDPVVAVATEAKPTS